MEDDRRPRDEAGGRPPELDVPASPRPAARELPGGRRLGADETPASDAPRAADDAPSAADDAPSAADDAPSGIPPEHPESATTDADPGSQVAG